MVHTLADAPQLRALIEQRRHYCQAAAALRDLLRALLQQDAEVAVRVGVPRIRRNRRAVRRLRAVDVMPLVLQQEAEVVVRGSVPWIRRNRRAVRRLRAVEVVWLWVATPPTAGATRTEPGAAAYTASDPDLGIPFSAQRYSWKLM